MPEDFEVIEQPQVEPAGAGEHLWVRVRKRNLDTWQVADRLARAAGVAPAAVGFAGLKDRRAVAEQWFSLHLPGRFDPDLSVCRDDRLTVLATARHLHGLRRGMLAGNGFRLRIRDFQGDRGRVEKILARIEGEGVPNYFGPQRFGREGGNLAAAEALLAGAGPRDRRRRGLLLSALRAALFNQVLAARVARGDWNRLVPGEVLRLAGSGACFWSGPGDEAQVAAGQAHPTGPLWGRPGRTPGPRGEAARIERSALADRQAWRAGLEKAGLLMDRRALRLPVADLAWSWVQNDLVLAFSLGPGSYATAVVRELVRDDDAGQGSRHLRESNT